MEWDLMSLGRRTNVILLSVYWSFAWGVCVAIALVFIATLLETGNLDTDAAGQILASSPILFAAAGLSIGLLLSFSGLLKQINDSKKRLDNKDYKLRLIQLGYIQADM
jgi:hypothetical protein